MNKAIGSKVNLDECDNLIAIEFENCVGELLNNKNVQELDNFFQHCNTSRLQHSINVSYYSYLISRFLKLDYKSAARAGLLHDLFLYDWRKVHQSKSHAFIHPKVALKNAKKIADLNEIEEDAILKHMWPLCQGIPKYKEAFVVTFADKYCAAAEVIMQFNNSIKTKYSNAKCNVKSRFSKAS